MTYAETSAANRTRDDIHMIYEMHNISQYKDGSVLECIQMNTFTAQQVVVPGFTIKWMGTAQKLLPTVIRDLQRNAKAAIKNGSTGNRAPLLA